MHYVPLQLESRVNTSNNRGIDEMRYHVYGIPLGILKGKPSESFGSLKIICVAQTMR